MIRAVAFNCLPGEKCLTCAICDLSECYLVEIEEDPGVILLYGTHRPFPVWPAVAHVQGVISRRRPILPCVKRLVFIRWQRSTTWAHVDTWPHIHGLLNLRCRPDVLCNCHHWIRPDVVAFLG